MNAGTGTPGIGSYVFDIVGTLVDEHETVCRALEQHLGIDADSAEVLTDAWQTALGAAVDDVVQGKRPWSDYETLRRSTLTDVIERCPSAPNDSALTALRSVGQDLASFPHAGDDLATLATRARVIGLTNSTLAAASRFSALGGLRWHALLSTDAIQAFKPQPAAYQYLIDILELRPAECVFVAAHPWDLRAAARHGFRTALLSRPHAALPTAADSFDFEIGELSELP